MQTARDDPSVQLFEAAMRLAWCLALALSGIVTFGVSRAHAQASPRQALVGMILQLQGGPPDPAWYSEELGQTLAERAGKTGIAGLRKLGPVQDIYITQQQQLPRGRLFSMTAQHSGGQSAWLLGFADASGRIEYASFDFGASPEQQRIPNPFPPGQLPPEPGNPPPPMADPKSAACKAFPRLC